VRDLVLHRERQAETLGAAFALRLVGGTLAVGLIAAVAWSTQADPTTRLAILIIALGLIFQSLEVSAYWFYARTFTRPVVVARLIALALISTLRITFILLDKPVLWFAVPVMLDAALAALLMFFFYLREGASPTIRWRPRLGRMKTMLMAAWPLALSVGLVEMQLRIDQVMLGEMVGPQEVGWYAAAARLTQMLYVLPTLIATATFPAIVRARETSQALYDRRMQVFYDLMLWLGIAVALPGTLIAVPVVRLLYGDAYLPTASILQIHLWSLVFVCLGTARGRWLIAEGLVRFTLLASVVGVTANIALNLALIPIYGGAGAAWATLLAHVIGVYALNYAGHRTSMAGRMMAAAFLSPARLVKRRYS
jgi:O-antigen/teichoic acid export membrane protein